MPFLNRLIFARPRVAIAFFFAAAGMSFSSWAVRMPYIQEMLHLRKIDWGLLLLCPVVSSLCATLLSNYLIQKYLSRRIVTLGVLLVSIALVLIGWANSIALLGCALFVFGSGMGLFNISMNDQAAALERAYQRSIMASFHGIFSLGAMCGALLGSAFAKFGVIPAYHLSIIAGVLVAGALLSYRSLLHSTRAEEEHHENIKTPLIVLPKGRLWLVGSIAIGSVFIEGSMSDWSALYLKDKHASEGVAALGLAVFTGAMAVGRLFGDRGIDYLGIVRAVRVAAGLTVVGLLIAVLTFWPSVTIAGFAIAGAGISVIFPCLLSLATRLRPPGLNTSAAIASVAMMGYVSLLTGPPVLGFLAQAVGLHISFMVLLAAGLLILGIASCADLMPESRSVKSAN